MYKKGGKEVAGKIVDAFGNKAEYTPFEAGMDVKAWVEDGFKRNTALVFISAAGIAVREVSPFITSKDKDPAVIVIDDMGKYVIPILSGHLGGGNRLARQLAGYLKAEAVITTATDNHGVFAIDEWARTQNLTIINPEGIKDVSSKLLKGEKIQISSYVNIIGEPPGGILYDPNGKNILKTDVIISENIINNNSAVKIAPKCLVIGMGCRRGVPYEKAVNALEMFLSEHGLYREAVAKVASIDIKEDEYSLHKIAEALNAGLIFYSSDELNGIRDFKGTFSGSDFVREVTGTDNVCERAAIRASGAEELTVKKTVYDSVTLAAAKIPVNYTWDV